jgi:hypothetical protein
MRTRTRTILAGVVLAAALVGGAAWATIPDATGVINACYRTSLDDQKGQVRIVDDPASCRSNETPINWNREGPQGTQGIQGPKGDKGDTGAAGADGTDGVDGQPGTNGTDGAPGEPGAPCLPTNPACVGPKGDKGDTGDRGAPGANGATGAQGTPGGLSGYQIVLGTDVAIPAGGWAEGTALCPAGKKAVGGGFLLFGTNSNDFRLGQSGPNSAGTGWAVLGDDTTEAGVIFIRVRAICVNAS